ncbi:MAG: hypothetical protein HRU40_13570 [Saprospiraceae bacterium]|nr:hypothetical protein [Saprospiraceae bacterium]
MPDIGFISASNGVYVVNDTTESTKRCRGFEVLEDTVVSNIKVNGNGTNVVADYISTPATALKAGALITPQGDDVFTGVTLSSGSIAQIL